VTSFDTDGFSLSGKDGTDKSGETYVAWNWKANGSGSSNTDGTITSTVSANVDAGFSISTYTGTGSAATIGHGLSKAPEMVVVKSRDAAENWVVFHTSINSGQGYIKLNSTDAATTGSSRRLRFGNDSDGVVPDSTKVYIGSGSEVNTSGNDYIAYCFHSVDGYSKVGSYVGNGNADGTFIYTGFRVGWLLVRRTDGSADWLIFDAERNTFNVVDKFLEPNTSDAEATESTSGYEIDFDFTSNGFKLRGPAGGINSNGANYIYMAFAETPFKYSNAR